MGKQMISVGNTHHAIESRITHRASSLTHRAALSSLLFVALLYVAALVAMPPEGLTHHDTGAKYLQVRNLRLTSSGLDWSINYPARTLDPNLEFVPFNLKQYEADSQGRIYLQWPIFLGLLTRIPWKLLGFWGLYLVPLLAGLGTLWASYLLAQAVGIPRRVAWLSIPLLGLATPISIYSLLFFEHTLASMLVTLSLLALVLSARGGVTENSTRVRELDTTAASAEDNLDTPSGALNYRLLAASAILLAVAVYFRSELYVLAFVIVLFCVWDAFSRRTWRPLLVWFGAFLLALVPLWAFYAINEGSILPLHATWYFAGGDSSSAPSTRGIELPRLRYIKEAGLGVIPDFLLGPQNPEKAPLSPDFPPWAVVFTLLGVALCALSALARFSKRLSQAHWSIYSLFVGLALVLFPTVATLFSPQPYYNLHGFLLSSPFVVLALIPSRKSGVQGSTLATERMSETPVLREFAATEVLGYSGEVPLPEPARSPRSHTFISGPRDYKPARVHRARPVQNRNILQLIILLYVALHVLIISALSGLGPISRNEWGQRYLLPAYPALVVLALAATWQLWIEYSARVRNLALALLALSVMLAATGVGFSVRGYAMLYDERTQVVAWQALARTLPAREPLLTDTWWLPLNLTADFYTRPIMLAESNSRIVKWAVQMRSENVTAFGLISPNRSTLTGSWLATASVTQDGPPLQSRGMWLQRYKMTK